jgi:YD repeat-containing protein
LTLGVALPKRRNRFDDSGNRRLDESEPVRVYGTLQPAHITNARGQTETLSYDATGQLIRRDFAYFRAEVFRDRKAPIPALSGSIFRHSPVGWFS